MGEVGNMVAGGVSSILKILLTIGGVGLAILGLVTSNWVAVGIGIVLYVLARIVHALDQRSLDVQLARWASEAVVGVGPVPPQSVRMTLIRVSLQSEGLSGDVKRAFQIACRDWAAEQEVVQ